MFSHKIFWMQTTDRKTFLVCSDINFLLKLNLKKTWKFSRSKLLCLCVLSYFFDVFGFSSFHKQTKKFSIFITKIQISHFLNTQMHNSHFACSLLCSSLLHFTPTWSYCLQRQNLTKATKRKRSSSCFIYLLFDAFQQNIHKLISTNFLYFSIKHFNLIPWFTVKRNSLAKVKILPTLKLCDSFESIFLNI